MLYINQIFKLGEFSLVKNFMEELVDQILMDLLENNEDYKHVCRCECCINDIKAIALNNIKPFYITGKKGEVYGEYYIREFQNNTNIIMEVVKAIERVNSNKSHVDLTTK